MTEQGTERWVEVNEGRDPWATAAAEVLTDIASSYGSTVTYAELAEEVQRRTGLRTRTHSRNWIGTVLAVVVTRGRAEGLPALTSLVSHRPDGGEPDAGTARARLACYRRFADDVPAEVVAQVEAEAAAERAAAQEAAREKATRPRRASTRAPKAPKPVKREDEPPKICPTCFVQLPASGICDTCS